MTESSERDAHEPEVDAEVVKDLEPEVDEGDAIRGGTAACGPQQQRSGKCATV